MVHLVMTQVQFSNWKSSRFFHLCTSILVPECTYITNWCHFAYACSQSTSVSAAVSKLWWLYLSNLGLHHVHLVLVGRAQDTAPAAL